MIARTFKTIPEGKIEESGTSSSLSAYSYLPADNWQDLLRSKRVLIVSEAGSGKTYECQQQCKQLWDAGEPAFFLELATLAKDDLRSMLTPEEEERFNQWLSSQSEVATFFLDSIDELKLSLGSFKQALKRLSKPIYGRLERVRVVITTRPIVFDELLVRQILPVPEIIADIKADAKTFAQVAVHGISNKKTTDQDVKSAPDWKAVALLPFSNEQIVEFARLQGVNDPKIMFADLQRRNAEEFARRPQDLIELCADWRDHKRIRTHREQVEENIRIKLKPREDRVEPAELSVEKALDGASRLALAMMMTRRLTIRHSAESDQGGAEAAFDPDLILPDWTTAERKALLERPLFGFASYGRVRFHHRSVMEFLAAERLITLRKKTMSARALMRLIFVETRGKTIVRHSKRAIAGWLALQEPAVFESLRDNEPDVLLNEGDPETLLPQQRVQALRAFVERHGKGGWRGIRVPDIQIHRFASADLSAEIRRLWSEGIENLEIREVLLQLIESGRVVECADIAFNCASDLSLELGERLEGIDALAALNDARLPNLVEQIASGSPEWSERLARMSVTRLFPRHMSISQLFKILPRLESGEDRIGDLSWYLPKVVAEHAWQLGELAAIRDGLTQLIFCDFHWNAGDHEFSSSYAHLSNLLADVCNRELQGGVTINWMRSSVIALLVADRVGDDTNCFSILSDHLNGLPAEHYRALFWEINEMTQSVHPIEDSWERFARNTISWKIRLQSDRDLGWIKKDLPDKKLCEDDRLILLEGAARLGSSPDIWIDHMNELRGLVDDLPKLSGWVDNQIQKSKKNSEQSEREIKLAKSREELREKERRNLLSWENFWRSVSDDPDAAFSGEVERNTAWNMWRAMRKAERDESGSGWNRRFIEDHLGKNVADRLRLALMRQWRIHRPTLTSERPAEKKGTYLLIWVLGLSGIYAESEDAGWAAQISSEEARLATRYATIELNKLPVWMESLVKVYPDEVEETLGGELVAQLSNVVGNDFHCMLLQEIGYSTEPVAALFVPRMQGWLTEKIAELSKRKISNGEMKCLKQVTGFLAKHGDEAVKPSLREISRHQLMAGDLDPYSMVWLPLLLKYDADAGVGALERLVQSVAPSQRSPAVNLLGRLFGDRYEGIDYGESQFTPKLLMRLIRLFYQHVRPEDDVHRTGGYSPDERDHAERARNGLVNVVLKSKGDEGWASKIELATAPFCAHFKDRILAVAEETWAEEADAEAFNDQQAVLLDKSGEAPPSSNETIFALMVNRLEEIDELLKQDISPRESWANNSSERVMRREIARELKHLSNGLYNVDQEAVTAEEKETDIRLRSTMSDYEAVIELKLADERTAQDLLDTLQNQLVKKYMASERSRSGCLLVTVAKERKWDNPNGGPRLNFVQLVDLLRKKADSVVEEHSRIFRLHVHAFDLSPRLSKEK